MPAASDLVALRLPRTYDIELLRRELNALEEVRRAPQPGPYHKGEWTGIALYSMGGKQSTFPIATGTGHYQTTEELQRAPYFKQILDELKCPQEVVRILFRPLEGSVDEEGHVGMSNSTSALSRPTLARDPDVQRRSGRSVSALCGGAVPVRNLR